MRTELATEPVTHGAAELVRVVRKASVNEADPTAIVQQLFLLDDVLLIILRGWVSEAGA